MNEAFAKYLTIHFAGAALTPAKTVIFWLALAAGLLAAYRLWHLGKKEDRRDRLAALRGAITETTVGEVRPRWYEQLGSIVAASPAIGRAEQQRLLGLLAAAGINGHGRLAALLPARCALPCFWRQWLGSFSDGGIGSATRR